VNLGRLSLFVTGLCLAGMVALAIVSVRSYQVMFEQEQAIGELLELDHRIEEFVSASHILLLMGADPVLWESYVRDSEDLHSRLEQLGERYPDARKAAYRLQVIVDSVESAMQSSSANTIEPGSVAGPGLLAMPARASITLHQVTSQSVALNTALDDAVGERKRAIAKGVHWAAAILIAAALAFGLLCLIGFLILYRKVVRPTRETINVLEAIRRGHADERVPLRGSAEMERLGTTLNSLLDERDAADREVRARQRDLEQTLHQLSITSEHLERAQRIGKIGTWNFDHDHQILMWSNQALQIFGQSRETFGDTLEDFAEIIHPDDRDWLIKKREDWLRNRGGFEARYRILRPDGELRWIEVRAELESDSAGVVRQSTGILIDVTEIQQAKIKLGEQAELLEMASTTARLGGWALNVADGKIEWSEVTAAIFGMPSDYSPTIDESIEWYAPEYRERVRSLTDICIERGQAYDEELEIVDAQGQRRWVRLQGKPLYDDAGNIAKVHGALQDISERKELERRNADLAKELSTMLESITDGFVAFDENWRYVYLNEEGARLLGLSQKEVIGTTIWSQFPNLSGTASEQALLRTKHEGVATSVEEYFEPLDAWFDTHLYPWQGGVASFFRDVSETHRMMDRLTEQQNELLLSRDRLDAVLNTRQALINSLPAHIALLDADATIIDVNQQWREYGAANDNSDPGYGVGMNYLEICDSAEGECSVYARQIAVGLRQLLAEKRDVFSLEYPCHSPHEQRWFRVTFNRLASDESVPGGAVAMHVDVTERMRAEQRLEQVAFIDPLTGLLTRNGFLRELHLYLDDAGWQRGGIIAMIDVVAQREINDVHGFEVGDQLLIELGRRLRECSGSAGLAGRGGGDEFVVYLPPVAAEAPEDSKQSRLQHLLDTVDEPFKLIGSSLNAKLWMGFSVVGDQPRDLERALREAELALFEHQEAKVAVDWVEYTQELAEKVQERRRLTEELKLALENNEFELHFQPKVDLNDGRLIAAEALLRWNHPVRGLQPPGLFIPIAEQSQLIGPIGEWALRDACRQLREWRDAGMDIVRISVNVSVVQFMMSDFPSRVRDALSTYGVAPADLSLEITESVFERQSEQLLKDMAELHEMGVRLSLDDFGTGYSSLLYLKKYPFDEIKIDRAFVSGLLTDGFSRNIVQTVLDVAAALGAEVVAEGIEDPEISAALLKLGCRIGQGFYYSVPLAIEDFSWLLAKHSTLPLSDEQSQS
jgi:diguanylate cyclase (GGDEF)-like protein/PAS domain S-box-containing protein